jgi:hypothetical protein
MCGIRPVGRTCTTTWPPVEDDAEALATAFREVLGAGYFESFLALIRAPSNLKRENRGQGEPGHLSPLAAHRMVLLVSQREPTVAARMPGVPRSTDVALEDRPTGTPRRSCYGFCSPRPRKSIRPGTPVLKAGDAGNSQSRNPHYGGVRKSSCRPGGAAYLFGAVEAEGPWGHFRIDHIEYSDQQIDFSEILGGEAPVCDDECKLERYGLPVSFDP